MIEHHASCKCRICQGGDPALGAGRIRAEVEVSITKRVTVSFDDDGVVCIEDQAAGHARDALGLALGDDMDVRSVRCFAQPGA